MLFKYLLIVLIILIQTIFSFNTYALSKESVRFSLAKKQQISSKKASSKKKSRSKEQEEEGFWWEKTISSQAFRGNEYQIRMIDGTEYYSDYDNDVAIAKKMNWQPGDRLGVTGSHSYADSYLMTNLDCENSKIYMTQRYPTPTDYLPEYTGELTPG